MVLFLGSSICLSVLCKHLKSTVLYTALYQEDFCLSLCFAVLDVSMDNSWCPFSVRGRYFLLFEVLLDVHLEVWLIFIRSAFAVKLPMSASRRVWLCKQIPGLDGKVSGAQWWIWLWVILYSGVSFLQVSDTGKQNPGLYGHVLPSFKICL